MHEMPDKCFPSVGIQFDLLPVVKNQVHLRDCKAKPCGQTSQLRKR